MTNTPDQTVRIGRALSALAIDPEGIGGLWLRSRAGPVRDKVMEVVSSALPHLRITPNIADTQLYGGVSISDSIAAGRAVYSDGVLAQQSILALAMAERCSAAMAGRLAQWLDSSDRCLIALDEGADADEHIPNALADRLGLFLDLDGLRLGQTERLVISHDAISAAQTRLADVATSPDSLSAIVALSMSFGCPGMRAPGLTLAVARALAALDGSDAIEVRHVEEAAALVLAPRATTIPVPDDAPQADTPPPDGSDHQSTENDGGELGGPLPDRVLEAMSVALPNGLLNTIANTGRAATRGGDAGSGDRRTSNRRGRPLPSRATSSGHGSRIDVVATLRAAAPWQTLRAQVSEQKKGLSIRRSDIRMRRFENRNDRVLIFCVDASGSAAMARMAEAKGAVELLLGDAYARRDHVALVAFRGTGAEELLPPTRSLVQTKRRLSALPGGGGTPLAAGLETGLRMSLAAERQGLSPTLVLLTDGRANIARDGTAGRAAAWDDSVTTAKHIRTLGIDGLIIDTGARPNAALQDLSGQLGADYLALPRANAEALSKSVRLSLES
ncbi:MAG: magnesium chelatase subunit D [Rhodobacteraceae bacterium]|nr:magnesium chelatase subunit D [Paracoccaceae bacterium]